MSINFLPFSFFQSVHHPKQHLQEMNTSILTYAEVEESLSSAGVTNCLCNSGVGSRQAFSFLRPTWVGPKAMGPERISFTWPSKEEG